MWKALMKDNTVATEDFKTLDYDNIVELQTNMKRYNIKVNLLNGVVKIDNKEVTNRRVVEHYGKEDYTPIQFRKVSELYNLNQGDCIRTERQYIGYKYTDKANNLKHQVLFEMNEELDAISMVTQTTDLATQTKEPEKYTRLI